MDFIFGLFWIGLILFLASTVFGLILGAVMFFIGGVFWVIQKIIDAFKRPV